MKKIKTVIGVCGGRLTGKDTVASFLQDCFLGDIWICSLADPIKEQYAKMMNINKDILYSQGKEKELHRMGLITLGAVRRLDDIDWWCKALHEMHEEENLIIPDIRYKNELEYYKKHSDKFILIEVKANTTSLLSRGWKESIADNTPSEQEHKKFIKDADYIIDNNGTQKELKIEIEKFYVKCLRKRDNFSLEYEWGSGKFPTYANTR